MYIAINFSLHKQANQIDLKTHPIDQAKKCISQKEGNLVSFLATEEKCIIHFVTTTSHLF